MNNFYKDAMTHLTIPFNSYLVSFDCSGGGEVQLFKIW